MSNSQIQIVTNMLPECKTEHTLPLVTIVKFSNDDNAPIQKLPLEIIAKIVRQLDLSDVINLLSVSKIWRTTYLNQNVIWHDICAKLNVREADYAKCLDDKDSHYMKFNEYFEANSIEYFGPICYWWKIYNQYNMVLKNIKDNNFTAIRIPREKVFRSYCTDDYIINIYHSNEEHTAIQVITLGNKRKPVSKEFLAPIDNFYFLLMNKKYNLQIIGNDEFLVLEIHSVIFVYKIVDNEFVNGYSKAIKRSEDQEVDFANVFSFLDGHSNTVIDLHGDKLALIHPMINVIFLVDLKSGEICKELNYCSKSCVVDTMKCVDNRLMIGVSSMEDIGDDDQMISFWAIVYHLEENADDHKFKVSLFGAVTQFKVMDSHIGIENQASATPILIKMTNLIRIIWIDCDTFSFDCTRKFLYYSANSSIFQYDLNKSRADKYEVTQKIAINAISNHFSLTPINDRFLLVQSLMPNSYNIFDVKLHNTVKSIPLNRKLKLAHVGKLCIMFASSHEFKIFSFS